MIHPLKPTVRLLLSLQCVVVSPHDFVCGHLWANRASTLEQGQSSRSRVICLWLPWSRALSDRLKQYCRIFLLCSDLNWLLRTFSVSYHWSWWCNHCNYLSSSFLVWVHKTCFFYVRRNSRMGVLSLSLKHKYNDPACSKFDCSQLLDNFCRK